MCKHMKIILTTITISNVSWHSLSFYIQTSTLINNEMSEDKNAYKLSDL